MSYRIVGNTEPLSYSCETEDKSALKLVGGKITLQGDEEKYETAMLG